ncbi:aldo/keto reductase [Lentzea roselyniae]|uniref:aldo/keto reductase n=1 Tax=Lentzea roselyniae TaxID=531940 RepID=UPI0031FA4502
MDVNTGGRRAPRATPAQTALAWLLTRGDDIAPIPGTRRVARVEESTAADSVELSAAQLDRLNNLTPAAGEPHDEANMGQHPPLKNFVHWYSRYLAAEFGERGSFPSLRGASTPRWGAWRRTTAPASR